jgi:Ca2+-dependent lipid-binding protein
MLIDPQPVKTDKTQSGKEYAQIKDITAPPDPIAPGSTSDVPINGEKTNILFHPTPSVSYEPMYQALKTLASLLAVSVLITIVVLGKMFGGALYGLIPLGMCISSGIFLWMKEVVRSGREVEWSSEQERGETVRILPRS